MGIKPIIIIIIIIISSDAVVAIDNSSITRMGELIIRSSLVGNCNL